MRYPIELNQKQLKWY